MNVPVAAGPVATGAAGAGPGDVPCPELPDGGDVCASASDRSASVDSAVDDIIKPRKTRLCMIRLLDFLDIVPARSALCDKCQTITLNLLNANFILVGCQKQKREAARSACPYQRTEGTTERPSHLWRGHSG